MKELDAMQAIGEALDKLEKEEIRRVLRWAIDKFDDKKEYVNDSYESDSTENQEEDPSDFHEFADLYYKASPNTDAENALVSGYWVQEIKGNKTFDSYSVNSELKQLGHKISNVTRAFNQLMDKKPQLAIQTKKTGSTKQARKRYKLTTSGLNVVREMLENNS